MKFTRDFVFNYPKRVTKDRGEPTQRVVTLSIATKVHIEIDTERLAEKLGRRAFVNKSGSAKLADGDIVAKATHGDG